LSGAMALQQSLKSWPLRFNGYWTSYNQARLFSMQARPFGIGACLDRARPLPRSNKALRRQSLVLGHFCPEMSPLWNWLTILPAFPARYSVHEVCFRHIWLGCRAHSANWTGPYYRPSSRRQGCAEIFP
jgi:hypothetical protein